LSWTEAHPFSSVFSALRCEIAVPACTGFFGTAEPGSPPKRNAPPAPVLCTASRRGVSVLSQEERGKKIRCRSSRGPQSRLPPPGGGRPELRLGRRRRRQTRQLRNR